MSDGVINRLKGYDIPRNWTFKDEKVADGFDRHVREQLPWYDMATGAIAHIARHYVPERGLVYDIGASTGNIARAIEPTIRSRQARYIGIDNSAEMVAKFKGPGGCIVADAMTHDYEPFDFAILFLVVMFMPVDGRAEFIRKLAKKVRPGGAIVVFEKLNPEHGYAGTVMRRMTLAQKMAANVPPEEIIAKELSLGGVQRPIERSTIEMLGLRTVQFFRFGEFAGWLIESQETN